MDPILARRMRLPMLFLGLALGAVTLFLMLAKKGEPLTAESLRAARAKWMGSGVRDYDFEIEVSGMQHGRHRIEVRGGAVTRMTTDGAATEPHVHAYWNVEGMLEFLEAELDYAARRPPESSGEVVLQALFEAEFGYPVRFLRHVTGERGSIEWEMKRFHRVRPGGD